jgi:phosphoribosylformylglycinamidine synthase II
VTVTLRDPEVTPDVVAAHGITTDEYEQICALLGRDPNLTELGVFSLMWSEHCGYKHSRARLAELPSSGPRVLQGPGENAGAIDIGDGLAIVFKMESHNHPSAVEPYQGAATGVGGILRDVFTMGARPIALLNSLRFGELDDPHVRYLFRHVVAGIGDYGNCVGVPTVGGEVVFDDAYRGNPLVNAMCVGLLPQQDLTLGFASGPGNAVYVLGASTGRDGIHGASLLASAELGDDTAESRPTVQVGDPFTEKLLLEATLELIGSGVVVGIQDMGAAGLTSSSSEMATRAGTGVELDVSRVPRREPGMSAYEVLLSESQERMLVVADPGRESELMTIADKWDLACTRIGSVTDDGVWRVFEDLDEVCAIPVEALTEAVPKYVREVEPPAYLASLHAWSPAPGWLDDVDPLAALTTLIAAPSLANKRWVFEQYDHHVRTATVIGPGADAALVAIKGTKRGLALTIDGNGRYVYCDPYRGGALAVAEAARNVTAVGATPLAITDCLNFGNPEKDDIYYQFVEALRGIADACRSLDTPVVSGNVSFYNQSSAGAVYPTPTIGMIGLLKDIDKRIPPGRAVAGDHLLLIGGDGAHLGASSFLKEVIGEVAGRPPAVNLEVERKNAEAIRALNDAGLIGICRDLGDGGLAIAAVELMFGLESTLGVELEIPDDADRHGALFGEDGARYIVTVADDDVGRACALLAGLDVAHRASGRVVESTAYDIVGVGTVDRAALEDRWKDAIPGTMQLSESNR